MKCKPVISKIILSLILTLVFIFLGDLIPKAYYTISGFDEFVTDLQYVSASKAVDGYVQVTAERDVRFDVPASAVVEMFCEEESGLVFEARDFQERRDFVYDVEENNSIRIFYEQLPQSALDAKRCRIDYLVTLHLPFNVQKTEKRTTGWFTI